MSYLKKTKEIITDVIYALANSNGTRSERLSIVYATYLDRIFVDKFVGDIIEKYCLDDYIYLKKVLWEDISNEMSKPEMKLLINTGFSGEHLVRRFHYKKSKKIIEKLINIHSKLEII